MTNVQEWFTIVINILKFCFSLFILITSNSLILFKWNIKLKKMLLPPPNLFYEIFYHTTSNLSNPLSLLLKGSKTHLFGKTLMFYELHIKAIKAFISVNVHKNVKCTDDVFQFYNYVLCVWKHFRQCRY